jgi:hypothetical protein
MIVLKHFFYSSVKSVGKRVVYKAIATVNLRQESLTLFVTRQGRRIYVHMIGKKPAGVRSPTPLD